MSSAARRKKNSSRTVPVKRYHGYAVFLFILGTLFPPLAVAARFGIGSDFWLNLLLTICGYIPGHGHNFYIQNIRNNKTHRRTPKWAQRYGLVDTTKIERDDRKSQWASRYKDRLHQSTLDTQPLEDGQEPSTDTTDDASSARQRQREDDGLWRPDEESYYGKNGAVNSESTAESTGRWHYPANFEDTLPSPDEPQPKKKSKKDRWARTEDAYTASEERSKKKKSKKRKSKLADTSTPSRDSVNEFPEDPEGGLYGERSVQAVDPATATPPGDKGDAIFEHQF